VGQEPEPAPVPPAPGPLVAVADCSIYRCDDGVDRGIVRVRFPDAFRHLNVDRAFPLPSPTAFRCTLFAAIMAVEAMHAEGVVGGTVAVSIRSVVDAASHGNRGHSNATLVARLRSALAEAGARIVFVAGEAHRSRCATLAPPDPAEARRAKHAGGPEAVQAMLDEMRATRAAAMELVDVGGMRESEKLHPRRRTRVTA
jgi:hypothetical protein